MTTVTSLTPDLPPVVIDEDYIETIREQLPELPEQKRQRFHRGVRPVRV